MDRLERRRTVEEKLATMTFYEAALQILLREGRPLHASEITALALEENLLSHVGKQPEVVMASRLAAMARRSHDRRLVAVEPDTFALIDWNVTPNPEALSQSGLHEEPEDEPPLRGRERHPTIAKEKVRISGRGERRRKEEAERRRRRAPTLADIVAEILERMEVPVPLFDLAALIRETDLVADDLGREALAKQLRQENSRREEVGRDSVFAFLDGGLVGLSGWPPPTPERMEVAPSLEEIVAKVAEERRPRETPSQVSGVEKIVADHRQEAIRDLRRRLGQLDAPALESVAQQLLESMGYRDIRVAKRHREGGLLTCRRRMGLVEVRFAVRVFKGKEVRREDVAELRKDMASHSAQIGVMLSPADPTREARGEASQTGQPAVLLLCADALADQMAELGLGVTRHTVVLDTFDRAAFDRLVRGKGEGAKRGEDARERRKEEREARRRKRQEAREASRDEAETKGEAKEAQEEKASGGERRRRSREARAADKDETAAEEASKEEEAEAAEASAEKAAPSEASKEPSKGDADAEAAEAPAKEEAQDVAAEEQPAEGETHPAAPDEGRDAQGAPPEESGKTEAEEEPAGKVSAPGSAESPSADGPKGKQASPPAAETAAPEPEERAAEPAKDGPVGPSAT